MQRGVLLDTSFLISLLSSTRAHHRAARSYWRYFLEQQIPIYLSTIVVSEFAIKQAVPGEILRCCIVLPFNWNDALKAAELNFLSHSGDRESRQALKDDVKIIAQAETVAAEYILTEDEATLFKFVKRCRGESKITVNCIKLSDGFDRAHFSKGQKDFHDELERQEEEEN